MGVSATLPTSSWNDVKMIYETESVWGLTALINFQLVLKMIKVKVEKNGNLAYTHKYKYACRCKIYRVPPSDAKGPKDTLTALECPWGLLGILHSSVIWQGSSNRDSNGFLFFSQSFHTT